MGGGEPSADKKQINVIVGSHLSPGDVTALRNIIESFGMRAIILPDLSALDGSRQDFSPLAEGGTTVEEIRSMGSAVYTLAVGSSMEPAAQILRERLTETFNQAEALVKSLSVILSKNEYDYIEETLKSRAIPTPKLLIKNHKKPKGDG